MERVIIIISRKKDGRKPFLFLSSCWLEMIEARQKEKRAKTCYYFFERTRVKIASRRGEWMFYDMLCWATNPQHQL